jgi:superfamily II DNA/RNA helicase
VLIATPGRLLDVFDRGRLLLNDVRILVIDEADRMLDMGFIPDVERIVSLVSRMRQTLLFSATMPPAIRRLADAFLSNPKEITVAPPATPAATVTQGMVVVADAGLGGLKEKRAALRRLIDSEDVRTALIFCNRKRDVGVVHRSLERHGYDAGLLHGDLAQSQRTEVLEKFKRGDLRLLVCSDVAARGLDIEDMSHVFNFDVPSNPEDYVHRIGRTGRAGRSGRAFTIAVAEDGKYVSLIENLIGVPIPRITLPGIPSAELEAGDRRRRRRAVGPSSKGRGDRPERGRSEHAPRHAPERHVPEGHAAERPARKPAQPAQPQPREVAQRPEPVAAAATMNPSNGQRRPRRPAQPRSPRENADQPVVGMGDHVPAFMLRDVPIRKKA